MYVCVMCLCVQWLTFPFLNAVFQVGDIKALLDNRTVGATLYGAQNIEKATVILGKFAHWTLVFFAPLALHGPSAAFIGTASYMVAQSVVLASTFAVSHNVAVAKPLHEGPTQESLYRGTLERDWGVQQLLTSANWWVMSATHTHARPHTHENTHQKAFSRTYCDVARAHTRSSWSVDIIYQWL